jgi:alpha-beta hydrolase superfamily lysophospholipase/ubiquinone/menaquinone biosynthesis C-methylase UbiE
MNALLDLPASATSAPPPTRAWQPIERTFRSFDGTELFYRSWLPCGSPQAARRKAIILFHRGHEHSGRWQGFVERLDLPDAAVFAWDARGHGRSPGERGWAPDFGTVVKDADAFVRHVCAEQGLRMEDVAVVAHSVGAVVAAAWVHDYAPPVRALVLATPALKVKLYVPLAIPSLRALQAVRRKSFVTSYVKSRMLTHDREQAAAYDADPLISKQIAVNILLDLHDTSRRLIRDAGAIATPTLVLGAGSDWVVSNSAAARFYERLSSPINEMHVFPGMGHAIFHETGRQEVVDRVRSFLGRQFAAPPADRVAPVQQYTRREYEKLAGPQPWYCPKNWSFKAQTAAMKTACRLSDGVRLGWRTGFDSGQSLDYVYRNRPRGITPLGKLIDFVYLNAIGWRGIRQRRAHLDRALRSAIAATLEQGKPARLLDIASGPGRYVQEILAQMPGADVSAILRDRSELALNEGRRLAESLGLTNVRFATGDAFSTEELAAVTPRPNIAIVSGLYELFPDNAPLERSLAGLARAMEPGGHLIYTNQPWHPQLEMIARTLVNRDGQPWIMRRRTQAEMDDLVQRVGFEKTGMEIDRWGIFTVSVARRVVE